MVCIVNIYYYFYEILKENQNLFYIESPILCQAWKRFSSNKMNNLTEILHFMRIQFGKKKSATIVNEAWIFNAIRSPIEFNSNSVRSKILI